MCHPVPCRTCGKITWAGCGEHVDEALRDVPEEDRCPGHENEASTGFVARLLRRG